VLPGRRARLLYQVICGHGVDCGEALPDPHRHGAEAAIRSHDLLAFLDCVLQADRVNVLEVGKDADLTLGGYHDVLVLELERAPEANLPALAEVNELDLELVIAFVQVYVFAKLEVVPLFRGGPLAHSRVRPQVLEEILWLVDFGDVLEDCERLAGDPETILVLVRCHGYLAVHWRHELLGELQGVAVHEQAPLPVHDELRRLLKAIQSVGFAVFIVRGASLRKEQRIVLSLGQHHVVVAYGPPRLALAPAAAIVT